MIEVKNEESYKSDKIKTEEEIVSIIKKLQEEGNKVGLCIGGYDLIHPGHMKHLSSAKNLCDVLVVGLTADKFNSKRKGDGRPVYSEYMRAFSLSQLSAVDFVFISNHETAVNSINNTKPDYYIKGPDYINKSTPGITAERNAISSIGGEILYTQDESLSTTAIINYIKDNIEKKPSFLLLVDRDGTLIEEKDFLGKNQNWKEEIKLLQGVNDFIKFIQNSAKCKTFVISNQSGVGRGFFPLERVEEINFYLNSLLKERGIKIDDWNYCPDLDEEYVKKNKDLDFNPTFIKKETKRKPSPSMVVEMLEKHKLDIKNFDKVIVLGDRIEDMELAKNINAHFLDVKNKEFIQLRQEFLVLEKNEL